MIVSITSSPQRPATTKPAASTAVAARATSSRLVLGPPEQLRQRVIVGHAEACALLLGAPVQPEQQRRRDRQPFARDQHGRRAESRDRDHIDRLARLGHGGSAGDQGPAQPLVRIGLGPVGGQAGAALGAAGAEQSAFLVDDGGAHARHPDVDAERDGHAGSKVVRNVWVCPVSAAR